MRSANGKEFLPGAEPDDDGDYLILPDFGAFHWRLTDVSLLIAIDAWLQGDAPGFTGEEWDSDWLSPEARTALKPFAEGILHSMLASVQAGLIEVEICGRSWPTSIPIASRTYVTLDNAIDWMRLHGKKPGDYLLELQEDQGNDVVDFAEGISRSRAQWRSGFDASTHVSVPKDGSGQRNMIASLQSELRDAVQKIAFLEAAQTQAQEAMPKAAFATRSRNTLLTLIAALCAKAGIDWKERGAASKIAAATDDLGAPVDDETVRRALREMPDAVERRRRG